METIEDQPQPLDVTATAQGGNPPGPYWNQVVNSPQGSTLITVPQAGTLWVYFEYQSVPPQEIVVWHQGGTTTPLQQGENFVSVGTGDMIYYVLANPATDSIKLAYQIS
jgi:hypothetical protein